MLKNVHVSKQLQTCSATSFMKSNTLKSEARIYACGAALSFAALSLDGVTCLVESSLNTTYNYIALQDFNCKRHIKTLFGFFYVHYKEKFSFFLLVTKIS